MDLCNGRCKDMNLTFCIVFRMASGLGTCDNDNPDMSGTPPTPMLDTRMTASLEQLVSHSSNLIRE